MGHQRDRVEDDNNELVILQPRPGTRFLRFRGDRAGRGVGWLQAAKTGRNGSWRAGSSQPAAAQRKLKGLEA